MRKICSPTQGMNKLNIMILFKINVDIFYHLKPEISMKSDAVF